MNRACVALLLVLAGCVHEGPSVAPSSGITMPREWWTRPAIVDAPLAQLVRVNVRGMPWRMAAQRLGFSGAGFGTDTWGPFSVMKHDTNDEADFAVYLDEGAETTYGVIVRGKAAPPTDVLGTLTEAARRAEHGDTWDLYLDGESTVLVSEVRPATEIGCAGDQAALTCWAAVYGPEHDPRAFPSIRSNESAIFQRRVRVR